MTDPERRRRIADVCEAALDRDPRERAAFVAAACGDDEALVMSPDPALDVVALDRALEALAKVDPRKGRTIELRFFGGLSVEETAEVLHVSPDTVKRDWRLAKLWLLRELEGEVRR